VAHKFIDDPRAQRITSACHGSCHFRFCSGFRSQCQGVPKATKASVKGYQAPPEDPSRCYSRPHQTVNTAACSPRRCGSHIWTCLSRDTSGTQSVPEQRNSRCSDLRRACQPKDNQVYGRFVRPQAPRSDPLRLQDIGYDSC